MAVEPMLIVSVGVPETTKFLIKTKLKPVGVEFRAPRSNEELAQTLNARNLNVSCLLVDGDYQDDRGQACCTIARSVNRNLPVLIMSSEQDKSYYVHAIRWGASGFIVKPFKGDALKTKLLECYNAQNAKSVEFITFDLEKYLMGEFRKAEKGRFSLSFMFATVVLEDPEEQGNMMSQAYYLNLFYETIRHLFWDTDAFIRLNFKYYLGVFPFCGQKDIETVTKKIHAAFNKLYAEKHVPRYVRLVLAFASYPDDSERFLDLQRMLADKVRMLMGDANVDWFI
jgi:DNA-binding NarL/FixJ family response regulator